MGFRDETDSRCFTPPCGTGRWYQAAIEAKAMVETTIFGCGGWVDAIHLDHILEPTRRDIIFGELTAVYKQMLANVSSYP